MQRTTAWWSDVSVLSVSVLIGAADNRLVEQHSGQPLGGAVQRTTAWCLCCHTYSLCIAPLYHGDLGTCISMCVCVHMYKYWVTFSLAHQILCTTRRLPPSSSLRACFAFLLPCFACFASCFLLKKLRMHRNHKTHAMLSAPNIHTQHRQNHMPKHFGCCNLG